MDSTAKLLSLNELLIQEEELLHIKPNQILISRIRTGIIRLLQEGKKLKISYRFQIFLVFLSILCLAECWVLAGHKQKHCWNRCQIFKTFRCWHKWRHREKSFSLFLRREKWRWINKTWAKLVRTMYETNSGRKSCFNKNWTFMYEEIRWIIKNEQDLSLIS